jgi:hypothetical protein
MFYSRPRIDRLGWDLAALPAADGSRNFAAVTTDGRPVDFRFSSGWLTVERGEVGASPDDDMQEILSQPIAPFGIVDIWPEQLCDILGLTVNGSRPSLPTVAPGSRGFDWSGQTTYWCSEHSMMHNDDAEVLAAKICDALPDAVMLQPVWLWQPPRVRCRQIRFLMAADEIVRFAIGCDQARLERILTARDIPLEEFETVLQPHIQLWRVDHGGDLTGSSNLKRTVAGKLELDYDVIHHRRYRIWVEYETDDARARDIMQTLLRVFDTHFCRGLEIVDLRTGEILEEDWTDEEDTRSYSLPFKQWCSERPGRYLFVGVQRPAGSEDERFAGYRPITRTGISGI